MDDLSGYVTLLLHMNGTNNSTTFIDSSLSNNTVTANGNAKISTAQSKWNGSSGYFDGQDSPSTYLSVPDSDNWHFSGPYTIEFWIYVISFKSTNFWIFQQGSGGGASCPIRIDLLSTGYIRLLGSSDNSSWVFTSGMDSTTVLSTGTWYHIAVCDDGTNCRLFLNGTQENSRATWSKTNMGQPIIIGGGYTGGDREFYGYIQDFRITKGHARYTGNFTAPASIFDNPSNPEIEIIDDITAVDIFDGGSYRITGTVRELGIVGSYRVRLFDRISARCIRETWSDASGAYAFNNIAYRANGYFVVAYDHGDNPLNAAIADLITPELIP